MKPNSPSNKKMSSKKKNRLNWSHLKKRKWPLSRWTTWSTSITTQSRSTLISLKQEWRSSNKHWWKQSASNQTLFFRLAPTNATRNSWFQCSTWKWETGIINLANRSTLFWNQKDTPTSWRPLSSTSSSKSSTSPKKSFPCRSSSELIGKSQTKRVMIGRNKHRWVRTTWRYFCRRCSRSRVLLTSPTSQPRPTTKPCRPNQYPSRDNTRTSPAGW